MAARQFVEEGAPTGHTWSSAPGGDESALLDAGLWIVADGMGGHAAGDLASRLAVELIATQWQCEDDAPRAEADRLRRAIQMADCAIRETARRDPDVAGMGTTVVTQALE